jgi:protoporphyrinogen oxidase
MIKGAPAAVRDAAAKLACTTCVIVNIGVARDDFSPATWSYFYDEDLTFARLSFPHKMSPHTCPPGCGSVQAECYFSDKYRPLATDPDNYVQPVIDDLLRVGLLRSQDEVIHTSTILARYANVIFDLDRETALPIVHEWLDGQGIIYAGRFGEWGYHWTDEAFKSGEQGAAKVIQRLSE